MNRPKILYGPPRWVAKRLHKEDRMMFGFWILVLVIVGSFFFGRAVLWVTVLAVLGMVPNYFKNHND